MSFVLLCFSRTPAARRTLFHPSHSCLFFSSPRSPSPLPRLPLSPFSFHPFCGGSCARPFPPPLILFSVHPESVCSSFASGAPVPWKILLSDPSRPRTRSPVAMPIPQGRGASRRISDILLLPSGRRIMKLRRDTSDLGYRFFRPAARCNRAALATARGLDEPTTVRTPRSSQDRDLKIQIQSQTRSRSKNYLTY